MLSAQNVSAFQEIESDSSYNQCLNLILAAQQIAHGFFSFASQYSKH